MNILEVIQIMALWIACMIGLLLFLKVRSKGKMKVLILQPNMQYEVKNVKTETNKLKMSKSWQPTFSPQQIFEEIKSVFKFWRNPNRLVLIPEKAPKAVGWKNESEAEFPELSHLWSQKEIKKFIKKEVLKARMDLKPMSNIMFYVLVAMVVFNLFLTFMIGNRIGVI